MYESMTYENLLADAKAEAGDGIQKGEGSLVFNALSALAYELEKLYIEANYVLNQGFADTADMDGLVRIAANRGLTRKAETNAYVSITANVALPIGWRASLKGYNYIVTEELDSTNHIYKAMCEEAGSGPNELLGQLTPIDYVDGLTSAVITQVLIAGDDDETQEELYRRYLESFSTEAFGGNITAYKTIVNAMDGVGGCKVYPVWDGVGTVKVVVISADYGEPSEYLVNQIQEALVPTDGGTGYGYAPIDHDVTVAAVNPVTVNVVTNITYTAGYSWATIGEEITAAVQNYIKSVAEDWPEGDARTESLIYVSRLEAAVLNVTGVTDITGTTLNGSTTNLRLASDEIPVMGTLTVH
jgi:uncharacterized phage protein gp47/JayE